MIIGYSVMANGGIMRGSEPISPNAADERQIDPIAILKIENEKGEVLYDVEEHRREEQVIDAASKSDAAVHLVHLRANSGNPPLVPLWSDPGVGRPVPEDLERIVEASDGRLHFPFRPFRPSVPEEIGKVLEDYRTRYVLRYSPTGVALDGWHRIAVTVPGQPRARIEARRGYFAAPPRQPGDVGARQ